MLQAGQLAGQDIGHYHLLKSLGEGGMGEVYLADDKNVKRQVAIKVVKTRNADVATDLKLFEREATAIARMNHPHILTLHEYAHAKIKETPITYMIMPYCPEGSFAAWLERRGNGPLPLENIVHFVNQAADALQSAHNTQVVHQDVKPDNFLIRHRDNAPLPDLLLADFGVARLLSPSGSITNTARGTLTYMAPEQWRGTPVYATDQYALAVMTYQLLTGQLPFRGSTAYLMYQHISEQPKAPSQLNSTLSRAIDEVVLRGMEKKPEDRYARVEDFANALQAAVAAQSRDARQGYGGIPPTIPAPPLDRRRSPNVETPIPPGGRSTSGVQGIPPLRDFPPSRGQGAGTEPGFAVGSFQQRREVTIPVNPSPPVVQRSGQKRLPIWIIVVAVALLLVALLMLLNTALQGFLFVVAAIGALVLAVIYTVFLGRWVGIPLFFLQLVLLAGAGYHHFSWHMGPATPVFVLLASLEPLFWVLFSIESVGVVGLFYYLATR